MRRIREKIICFVILPLIISGCIFLDKQFPQQTEEVKAFEPDLSVETMYLTIFQGNSENDTDHTWEDINKYSNDYYEELGIERYRTEALLQAGDESGPLPDKLGYGQTQPNSVISIRGASSSNANQKSYRIKLTNKDDYWNGIKIINLNKHEADGFRFCNKLLYDLMSEVPQIISLNTKFVHLFVKDHAGGNNKFEDYGLYTQVEQVDKDWLESRGLDRYGYLYKENILFEFYRYENDIRPCDDPFYNEANFTTHLKTKGSQNHSKLIKMLDELNYSQKSEMSLIKKYFDTENIAYWMAFMVLTGNVGNTTSHNLYIYSSRNKNTWYLIPWDNDKCFWNYRFGIDEETNPMAWRESIRNYWGNQLFRYCLSIPSFRKELDNAINDLHDNYMNLERFTEKVKKYSQTVKPYIYRAPDVTYAVFSEEKYDAMIEGLYSQIDKNYNKYLIDIKKPMPFFGSIPVQTDDGIKVSWGNSYNIDGGEITYDVKLSYDPSFSPENIIAESKNIIKNTADNVPNVTLPITLEPGMYFISISAKNEAGYSQVSFDRYAENGRNYNAIVFYVSNDGTIKSEINST